MCHFITAVIDGKNSLDNLNYPGCYNIITFHVCDNLSVRNQLRANELYVARNRQYCDCGTELGMLARCPSPAALSVGESEIDRLKKKGWGERKIQRWIADREKNAEKAKIKYDNLTNGKHSDVENWLQYLHKVFSDPQISHLGLLLHWYSGGLEDERIAIKQRKRIEVNDLTAKILLTMEEDVIYDIVR